MTTDNENLCYLKNFKFFWNFGGFDMWYQSMVQILGLAVAQLVFVEW